MATSKPGKARKAKVAPTDAAAARPNPYDDTSAIDQASEDAGLGPKTLDDPSAAAIEHHPWTPIAYKPNHATYRCIAFDGGPNTLSYLHCLLALELRRPGFLDRTQLFAGTSDGAFAAAFLASQRELGTTELLRCIEMIEKILTEAIAPNRYEAQSKRLADLIARATNRWSRAKIADYVDARARALSSVGGVARLLSGLSTWADHAEIAKILAAYIGHELTLGQTPRDLVIVTYAVHAANTAATHASGEASGLPAYVQRPKVYQNIDRADADCAEHVIEAAMRSAALPMFLPIHAQHVDGAVFANNPAMCAIAAAMAKRSKQGRIWYLKDLVMLSMGSDDGSLGSETVHNELGSSDELRWGWAKWAFHGAFRGMKDLMLILDVMLNSDAAGVNYQAAQLLGRRYLRIAPPGRTRTVDKFVSVLKGDVRGLIELARNTAYTWHAEADLPDDQNADPVAAERAVRAQRAQVAASLRAAGADPAAAKTIEAAHWKAINWLPGLLADYEARAIALGNTQSICAAMRWADEVWLPGPTPSLHRDPNAG